MRSKWSYIGVGVNVMTALLGAIGGSLLLICVGSFFAMWSWQVAEYNYEKELKDAKDNVEQGEE